VACYAGVLMHEWADMPAEWFPGQGLEGSLVHWSEVHEPDSIFFSGWVGFAWRTVKNICFFLFMFPSFVICK
jgi:hypothetical protein